MRGFKQMAMRVCAGAPIHAVNDSGMGRAVMTFLGEGESKGDAEPSRMSSRIFSTWSSNLSDVLVSIRGTPHKSLESGANSDNIVDDNCNRSSPRHTDQLSHARLENF